MLECQFEYILQALPLLERSTLEVRADAMDRFNLDLRNRFQGSAWLAGCTNWYKNAAGRITNNWSGTVEDYKAATAQLDCSAYEMRPRAAVAAHAR